MNPSSFAGFYAQRKSPHLYPTEFVIRAFLGNYPQLALDKNRYAGATILDLGYGDGRNMPLLHNCGFVIHGVEMEDDIHALTQARLGELGIHAELRTGSNASIPYGDGFFAYVLACHSCYYVMEGMRFADNLSEIARVMQPGGTLVCSLPKTDTYILEDAILEADGLLRITRDPFGLRNGVLFRAFADAEEITAEFSAHFDAVRVGSCDDDYWGLNQKLWIVAARRRG